MIDQETLAQVDRLLASYFDPLKNAVKEGQQAPQVNVTVPDITIPPISVPPIPAPVIPEIHIPPIIIPPIKAPDVTVNVDHVSIDNLPEPVEPDNTEILDLLQKLVDKPIGGGGGPTEYKDGGAYASRGLFGNVPMWDDGGTMRAVSAAKPLPVTANVSVSDIEIGAVEIKDGATDQRATVNGSGEVLVKETTLDNLILSSGGETGLKTMVVGISDLHVQGVIAATSSLTGISPVYVGVIDGSGNAQGLKGDATNGAYVQVKSTVSTPVTGTFWQTTQPVSIASMPSTPVTGTFWQSTQPISIASGQIASGALAAGSIASGAAVDGSIVTLGAKADAANTATDTTAITLMQVDKQISKSVQSIDAKMPSLSGVLRTTQSVTATTSTAATNFGATASKRNYITGYSIWNNSATDTYFKLQDGNGGTTFWVIPAPKGGGANVNFDPPIPQPTTNTALYFATNDAVTTAFISLIGFQAA